MKQLKVGYIEGEIINGHFSITSWYFSSEGLYFPNKPNYLENSQLK